MKSVRSAICILALAVPAAAPAEVPQPGMTWIPADPSNYTVVSGSRTIDRIVVHTMEGTYEGTIAWFRNPKSDVSAHYLVAHDGRLANMVRDLDIAWHVGTSNYRSIGIENEGYTYQNTWTRKQYEAGAQLTAWLCEKHGIPVDRQHIVGHVELPNQTHTDPGPYFDWPLFMDLVRAWTKPPPVNQAPSVAASASITSTDPPAAAVTGVATDDGLPNPPDGLSFTWSKVSGPGSVAFDNPASPNTTARFTAAGEYVLRLTVSDGALSGHADAPVTIRPPEPQANAAPGVNVKVERFVDDTTRVRLIGTAGDDGLPNPPGALTCTWAKVTGPGEVTFENPAAPDTIARFTTDGQYILRLSVSDGELSSHYQQNLWIYKAPVSRPTGPPRYRASEIAAPEGGVVNFVAINNNGVVLFTSQISRKAYIHDTRTGVTTALGSLFEGSELWPADLNDSDEAVGYAYGRDAAGQYQERAFRWHPERGFTDLGLVEGGRTGVYGINNRGQMVGFSYRDDWIGAFLLEGGAPRLLNSAFPENSGWTSLNTAVKISNNGHIIGDGNFFDGTYTWRPKYLLHDGILRKIVAENAYPWDMRVNDSGRVVGIGTGVWDPQEGRTGLTPLAGFGSNSLDLNNAGDIVGESWIPLLDSNLPRACLWTGRDGVVDLNYLTENALQNLNTRVDPEFNWNLAAAVATNDAGLILCKAWNHRGEARVLLTPLFPKAFPQTVYARQDTPVDIEVKAISFQNRALTYGIVEPPRQGTIDGTGPRYTYRPAAGFHGHDRFAFRANDGTLDGDVADVDIVVENGPPSVADLDLTTAEDVPVAVTLSAADPDGDAVVFRVVRVPAHGTLSGFSPDFTYTPDPNYAGGDAFTYRANDGATDSAESTVRITMTAVNDPPVATPGNVSLAPNTVAPIRLQASDAEGSPLTYAVVAPPRNGVLGGSPPDLTYTPARDFVGDDAFTFRANDGAQDGPAATVSIRVTGATLWTWGTGPHLDGAIAYRPVPVATPDMNEFTRLACGDSHVLARRPDGALWAWGDNYYGQLGRGVQGGRLGPAPVAGPGPVRLMAAGKYHSLAVLADGSLWGWGDSSWGQLPGNTRSWESLPVRVQSPVTLTALACSRYHSLGVAPDGSVWAWGNNHKGQLGVGTTNYAREVIPVAGLKGVHSLGAGGAFSVALAEDGSVWGWGDNWYEVLGIPATLVPRKLPLDGFFRSVAVSLDHLVLLRNDGTVWSSGANGQGQLGHGAISDSGSFAPVLTAGGAPLDGVVQVATGVVHSLALRQDGTVWAWGGNASGQLGDASRQDRAYAAPVPGVHAATEVAGMAGGGTAIANEWAAVTPVPPPPSDAGDGSTAVRFRVTVRPALLNLRRGPAAYYDVIGTVSGGQTLDVYEERPGWYRVRTSPAWISSAFADRVPDVRVVGPGGYPTLQAAMDSLPATLSGDVIVRIGAGTYPETLAYAGSTGTYTLTIRGEPGAVISGGGTRANGVVVTSATGRVRIETLSVQDTTSNGIAIGGGLTSAVVTGCTVKNAGGHGIYATVKSALIEKNTVTNCVSYGICGTGATQIVRLNKTSGNFRGVSVTGTGTVVERNAVTSERGTGIYASGGSSRVTRNTVKSCAINGIYVTRGGTMEVSRNTVRGSGSYAIRSYTGTTGSHKIQNNLLVGGKYLLYIQTPGNLVYNNSGLTTGTGAYFSAANNKLVNNILWAKGSGNYAVKMATAGQTGFTSNYNILYVSNYARIGYWGGAARSTLTAWRTASGKDANSQRVNPLYKSTTAGVENLRIQSTSPAKDKGTNSGAPNVDVDGQARPYNVTVDVGADEYRP